ncbi:hypothetical protein [Pseudomonas sp. 58 R 3]|nr:hypothetical protein [Pseudomonas sp. 58 R 3]
MTMAWRSPLTAAGRANQGLGVAGGGVSSGQPRNSPRRISHLWPMPGVRFILKPAALISRRTQPVLVKVLMVEPGAARRASSANNSAVHMSGFLAGAKPSRNHASICASSCGNCSRASPINSVRVTRPLSSTRRWKPGWMAMYCASSCSAKGCSSGQRARARCRSAWLSGYFSTLTKCRRAPGTACCSNSCQAHRKFSPVPKPVSPITNRPFTGKAAKRSCKRFCSRNT